MTEITPELKKLIEENALALATIDETGTPHCIAVVFAKIVSSNQILITDNYMAETKRNIQNNSGVALTVWNKDWENKCIGYELKGNAEYFNEGKWRDSVKEIPENKGEPCKGAILIILTAIKKLA